MNSRTLLRTIAPEFAGLSDEALDAAISMASLELDVQAWGVLYQKGAVRLAAHELTIAARTAAAAAGSASAGAVVAVKAGDLQVNYGAVLGVLDRDSLYATTPHGAEFLRLRRLLGGQAFAIGYA